MYQDHAAPVFNLTYQAATLQIIQRPGSPGVVILPLEAIFYIVEHCFNPVPVVKPFQNTPDPDVNFCIITKYE